jgi:hypothetical protein
MNLNFSDLTLVLFALVVIWLAVSMSGGSGGGHRVRVPNS